MPPFLLMVPSSFTVQAFRVILLWMSAPSARVLTSAAEEVPKALNCQPFAEVLFSANAASGVMPSSSAPVSSPATVRRMGCFAFFMVILLFPVHGADTVCLYRVDNVVFKVTCFRTFYKNHLKKNNIFSIQHKFFWLFLDRML